MVFGRLLLMVMTAGLAVAQSGLRFEQLDELLRSSFEQGHRDRDVAKFLKTQKLQFSLSDAQIEQYQGLGAGPKTLESLRELQTASKGLPPPDLTVQKSEQPNQPPPPSPEEQRRILDEARRNALAYTGELPDFLCLQITRRYIDPSGLEMDWLRYDEVKTRVSYVEGREDYDVVSVNNSVTTKGIDELGGAISTGEFGTMLADLFALSTDAKFTWARHSLLRGRPVYVFAYRVPKERSRLRITYQKIDEIVSGYAGLVYIDKETEQVLRINREAEGIPPAFPIRKAASRLDYDYIEISNTPFLLPLKAEMSMRTGEGLMRNDVEFRLYRKFSAEAVISFDEIDDLAPLPEDAPGQEP